jgi:hypothetical protein
LSNAGFRKYAFLKIQDSKNLHNLLASSHEKFYEFHKLISYSSIYNRTQTVEKQTLKIGLDSRQRKGSFCSLVGNNNLVKKVAGG